jgi:hypothetical protein
MKNRIAHRAWSIGLLLFVALCSLPSVVPALQRNVSSQTICAELVSKTDGSAVTTGTTTVYVTGDGGAQAEGSGTVTHEGQGLWCYAPTQADTNYSHVAFTFANSSAVPQTVQTYPGGVFATALSPGVLSDVITVSASAVDIRRGDVVTFTFSLGPSWPLTGKKAYFIAKKDRTASNSTAIVNRECTVTDAANGVAEIALTDAETAAVGSYYAEVEVRDADDTNPKTARQFTLRISQDVRQ